MCTALARIRALNYDLPKTRWDGRKKDYQHTQPTRQSRKKKTACRTISPTVREVRPRETRTTLRSTSANLEHTHDEQGHDDHHLLKKLKPDNKQQRKRRLPLVVDFAPTLCTFSAKRSFLLRNSIIDDSLKNRLLQISLNKSIASIILHTKTTQRYEENERRDDTHTSRKNVIGQEYQVKRDNKTSPRYTRQGKGIDGTTEKCTCGGDRRACENVRCYFFRLIPSALYRSMDTTEAIGINLLVLSY